MSFSRKPSCDVCYKRKIKCDRQSPCSNCQAAEIRCVVPARQPPKRSRYERSTEVDRTAWEVEVDERIRSLEKVIQQLRKQTPGESIDIAEDGKRQNGMDLSPVQRAIPAAAMAIGQTDKSHGRNSMGIMPKSEAPATELANLVIDGGRSRYVNDRFWAHLINEVCPTSWDSSVTAY